MNNFEKAAQIIKNSKHTIVFTGAGISAESGIPTFRGKGGLYEKVSSTVFDLDYFFAENRKCWYLLLKFILIPLLEAKPNDAHYSITELQNKGYIKTVITQNIDILHEKAGNQQVLKFHGTSDKFKCINCGKDFLLNDFIDEEKLEFIKNDKVEGDIDYKIYNSFKEPRCNSCGSIIKPQIVFFKEGIPEDVLNKSFYNAQIADCILIIGTSGVVYPAAMIPQIVHRNNGKIIEINAEPTFYTKSITDIFFEGFASKIMKEICSLV